VLVKIKFPLGKFHITGFIVGIEVLTAVTVKIVSRNI
jgi:hypothetical protein